MVVVSDDFVDRVIKKYHCKLCATGASMEKQDTGKWMKPNDPFAFHLTGGALLRLFENIPNSAVCSFLRFALCGIRKTLSGDDKIPSSNTKDEFKQPPVTTEINLNDDMHLKALMAAAVYYFA